MGTEESSRLEDKVRIGRKLTGRPLKVPSGSNSQWGWGGPGGLSFPE